MAKIDIPIFCPNCLTGGVIQNTPCEKNCQTMKCLMCLKIFHYLNGIIYNGHDRNCFQNRLPV